MGGLVNRDFLATFKGKRVLVTGDTGFKGSWLSLWLKELGADVLGYALPPEQADSHFNLLGLDRLIHHVDGNILDYGLLQRTFAEFQPEYVFHLAAQALVRFSYDQPKLTFDTNVAGSVNMLEMARSTPSLRALIYVTSDKCYRNNEWVWGYRENDPLGGHDPYSASKAAAEIVFSGYADSYFSKMERLGAASVRAGNVIGGGDWALDRIVPDAIKALTSGRTITLRNPDATRPWQHVLEPLSGYLLLASRLAAEPKKYAGAWNFGPDGESIRTVRDLSEAIVKNWGSGKLEVQRDPHAPHEAGLLHLSCDKANHLLGWHPRWGFDDTIGKTVAWYKEVGAGRTAQEISIQQIRNYMEIAA
jgi:CDP-glucose 4,6-dehydratase